MDKISIIVPIYNAYKYLDRCINSLVNQTYKNIEIILLNDGSRDDSIKIINKYASEDKRIIVVDKENTGVSDTRNIGIKKATGKYICFCDADDMYDKDYIKIMYETIKQKNVDMVRCNYKIIDSNNKFISKGNLENISNKYNNKGIKDKIIPLCLNGNMPCFTILLMIKKEKLNISFKTDVAMMEDLVFYIELLTRIDSLYIINNTLYTIMYNEEGATNNKKNYKRNILNIISVNTYIRDILKDNNLYTEYNIKQLNLNHLNSISDYIFKYYLAGEDAIKLCISINNEKISKMIEKIDLKQINFQRRYILNCLYYKKYNKLKIYFKLRKFIYEFRKKYRH